MCHARDECERLRLWLNEPGQKDHLLDFAREQLGAELVDLESAYQAAVDRALRDVGPGDRERLRDRVRDHLRWKCWARWLGEPHQKDRVLDFAREQLGAELVDLESAYQAAVDRAARTYDPGATGTRRAERPRAESLRGTEDGLLAFAELFVRRECWAWWLDEPRQKNPLLALARRDLRPELAHLAEPAVNFCTELAIRKFKLKYTVGDTTREYSGGDKSLGRPLMAYTKTILVNHCSDLNAKLKPPGAPSNPWSASLGGGEDSPGHDPIDTKTPDPVEGAVTEEERDLVRRAVASLENENQRYVIQLIYFEGCSVSEVAGILRKPCSTVSIWRDRGLQHIQTWLERKGFQR